MAAGWLLVEEAGGVVTNLHIAPFDLHSPHILASNGLIHAEMSRLLARTDPLYNP
jgi:myo-inositol-1(or 4)-monophosphatase